MRTATLPGSLFQVKDLAGQPISGTLRAALRLLGEKCQEANQRLLLIARPEIYTHGEALGWLKRQLGGIEDHLNISDGSTIQLIPGMRNHLFFYNPGLTRNMRAFQRFVGRAPEVPPQIARQVNTALTFRMGQTRYTPPPLLLQASSFFLAGEVGYRHLYLNPDSVSDSVDRLDAAAKVLPDHLDGFGDVLYIPFTDAAASDAPFCRLVVKKILETLAEPTSLLILGLPLAQDKDDTFAKMLAVLLHGLGNCGAVLPRAVLPNVVITSSLLDDRLFAMAERSCSLILHETFEFWRSPPAYYEGFRSISVASGMQVRYDTFSITDLMTEALRRVPQTLPVVKDQRASIRSTTLDE